MPELVLQYFQKESFSEEVMEITDVRVRKVRGDGKLKAYATVTFDHAFVIHNVKIIEGKNGYFIAMPSRKIKSGEYKDVAHPIRSDFRNLMKEVLLESYEKASDEDSIASDEVDDFNDNAAIDSVL